MHTHRKWSGLSVLQVLWQCHPPVMPVPLMVNHAPILAVFRAVQVAQTFLLTLTTL